MFKFIDISTSTEIELQIEDVDCIEHTPEAIQVTDTKKRVYITRCVLVKNKKYN